MPRKFFVGGNWKCNGTVKSNSELVKVLNDAEVKGTDVVGARAPRGHPSALLFASRQCFPSSPPCSSWRAASLLGPFS